MLYVSSECDYGKAVDAVRKATNNAPLIRASSAGEFTEKPVEKGSVAVGLLSSDDIKVFTALAEGVKENPRGSNEKSCSKVLIDGAEGETRTPTEIPPLDPEPSASTSSATSA